jgi:hypothetical protein
MRAGQFGKGRVGWRDRNSGCSTGRCSHHFCVGIGDFFWLSQALIEKEDLGSQLAEQDCNSRLDGSEHSLGARTKWPAQLSFRVNPLVEALQRFDRFAGIQCVHDLQGVGHHGRNGSSTRRRRQLSRFGDCSRMARSESSRDWVRFAKNAASSHRFCFGGLRRRTRGPPPFSSISSSPRLRRAPSPPPFSSINSTPAFSRARRMADALANVIVVFPSVDSARWIVAWLTPDSRTRSAADQRRSARAALI